MGESQIPHKGIELDAIDLSNLNLGPSGKEVGKTPSDPEDFKVFANGILKKMKAQEAFLSFSRQLDEVNQILVMKYSSAQDIADVILRDMALTSKVLKVVNSSFYRHFSPKGISTISEAMIILGTDEIRSLAASLKIYEMLQDRANSRILKEKTLKGLQRSVMARQLAEEGGLKDPDVIQVSALIHDLGEYLAVLLAPEKYIQVELAMEARGLDQQEAAKTVLGLTYTDLGMIIASKLNMPESIVDAMKPFTREDRAKKDLTPKEKQRCICTLTRELCDIPGEGNRHGETVADVAQKYAQILDIDPPKALKLIRTSREQLAKHAALWQVDFSESDAPPSSGSIKGKKALDKGLKSIKQTLDDKSSIHETLTRIVETIHNSFYFTHVAICIRQKDAPMMAARFAKGARAKSLLEHLSFEFRSPDDLFSDAVLKKKDIIVKDISRERESRIPGWYSQKAVKGVDLSGLAVFPVRVNRRDIALIYMGWKSQDLAMDQKALEYIHLFRELMIKAFIRGSRVKQP